MPARSRPLVLASASPRRHALLKAFGLPFRVVVSDAQERDAYVSPSTLVRHNAVLKAEAVARTLRSGVVIGADTVVTVPNASHCLGKPKDARDALRMVKLLSGRTHRVYTCVCTLDVDRRRRWVNVAMTRVTMRALSQAEMRRYVATRAHWDKAGAYAVQDLEHLLIDRIDGSLSNVIGLPLDVVERHLKAAGILR